MIMVLLWSLNITILLSGIALLFYWLLPGAVVHIFFGQQYATAATYTGWYGTAMLLFAVNYLFVQYYLAVASRSGITAAVVVTIIEVVAIIVWHQSLWQVIIILLAGNLLLMLTNVILLFVKRLNRGHI